MAHIKPFKALRPKASLVQKVASLPYDVCSVEEAKAYKNNPHHFYHITRSEIDLPDNVDIHSPQVYDMALENLNKLIQEGVLKQEETECYYIYRLTMNGRAQTGLLCLSSIDDYRKGIIKKHEFTRPEKEQDRINHIRTTRAQTGVVFLAYRNVNGLDMLIKDWIDTHLPAYDFVAEDGIGHSVWVVDYAVTIQNITELFDTKVPATYIADGHHRAASAAKVAAEDKGEGAQYFLTCIFPENQLEILDYNRVVKDLNGLSNDEFVQKLTEDFVIEKKGSMPYKPKELHEFGLYIGKDWYQLKAKNGTFNTQDPITSLDVSILQDNILSKILNINDPRTDKRVEFVGGIRGLEELAKRVDSGEMAAAFSCYPVQLSQLFAVADSGSVMPPKSTWFEPKTRDGIAVYTY